MSDEAVLTYFEGRGLGEIIRLTLAVAKIPFKQKFVHTSDDLQKLITDGKLLFNQLPLLEIDGMNLTQSTAIVRYVGEKGGLIPKDPKQTYRGRDAYAPFLRICLVAPLDELKPKLKNSLNRYLPVFDKELRENGTGYLVGSSITLADVALLNLLLAGVDYFGDTFFDKYPEVKKFLNAMRRRPEVVTYMENFRQRGNDEKYISDLKAILPADYWKR